MADQIKVFELNIDVDAAIKSTSELKKTTDNLKKTLNEFKEAGDTSSEAYIRTAAAVKSSSTEYNAAQTQISKLLALKGKEVKTVQQGRNALTILNKEWAKATNLYGKNSKEADKLAKQHKELKDRVNELQKGVGDTSANIGRYSEGFTEVIGKTTLFGRVQRGLNSLMKIGAPVMRSLRKQLKGVRLNYIAATTGLKGMSVAQKASTITTNLLSAALKLFRIALISTGIGAVVVLLGSFVSVTSKAIKASRIFEKSQSQLQAVLGVTKKEMQELSKEAIRLGSSTAYTASEVSNLQTEFAKLGFPTEDIINLTKSTLDAAAAMGSGLAETAKLTGSALKAFQLESTEAARVNDVLSVSTTKSALDFGKLSSSLSTVAPIANAAGFSLENTVALLGSLSDAGFESSVAATSTRNILLNLADANGALSKSLSEPVKDLPSLIRAFKELDSKGINLSEALQLTDKRSVAAFKTFLTGTESLEKLGNALDEAAESGGAAAEAIARIKLNNLEGDVTKLSSAWEGFLLTIENGNGILNLIARTTIKLLTQSVGILTGAVQGISFGFWEFVETTKSAFFIVLNTAKLFGESFKLVLSKIPILGGSLGIDVEKTTSEIKSLTSSISNAFESEYKRLSTASERFAEENAQRTTKILAAQEIKNQGIASQRIANAKKVTTEAIKESKIRLQLFIEQNKGEAESLEQGLKLQEDIRDKKLEILEQQIAAGNKTQVEGELEALKIKNDFLQQQAQLTVDFADQEFQQFKLANQTRIQEGQILSDELVAQEIARIEAVAEAERVALDARLENGVISQQEYNAAIAEVNAEAKTSSDEIELEQKEQKAEADAIDFENEQEIAIQNGASKFEIKLAQLERDRVAEVEAAEKVGADTTKIHKKYDAFERDIKIEALKHDINAQEKKYRGVAELLGKEAAAGKAAGIATATINTYQGVTEVWRAKSTLPEPFGTAAKVLSTATVLASGLSTVKKITSTKVPKAAKGITLQGNSHAQGGIDLFDGAGNPIVNAEGGENIYVINKRAAALIHGLSAVNEATGGVPLSTHTNFAADGGLIGRSIKSSTGNTPTTPIMPINYDLLAQKIGQQVGEANLQLPPPITDVQNIIDEVGSLNQIVDGANQ